MDEVLVMALRVSKASQDLIVGIGASPGSD